MTYKKPGKVDVRKHPRKTEKGLTLVRNHTRGYPPSTPEVKNKKEELKLKPNRDRALAQARLYAADFEDRELTKGEIAAIEAGYDNYEDYINSQEIKNENYEEWEGEYEKLRKKSNKLFDVALESFKEYEKVRDDPKSNMDNQNKAFEDYAKKQKEWIEAEMEADEYQKKVYKSHLVN
jgi:hypothetical protein